MDKLQVLGFRLNEVARLYTRRFEERAQTLSLQLAQCKALILLAENEGVSQAQRRRRPGDRRVRSLAVTENAKPVLQLIWSVISETYAEALQGLSTEEIGTMAKVLERVHSNLSARRSLGADPDTVVNEVTARRRLRFVR
jgi:MarR family transcriptional regulator, transcriptional regulator for hemolysin